MLNTKLFLQLITCIFAVIYLLNGCLVAVRDREKGNFQVILGLTLLALFIALIL